MTGFKRAQRTAVKLKVLNAGPSGSGKTLGALTLAASLFPGKVAGIDSENDRMLYYADKVEFDHMSLANPKPSEYIAAIDSAVAEGYEAIVIDSLSHGWQNVLDRKAAAERANPKANGFTLWGPFGSEWDSFLRHILAAPIHVFATSRSKQAYEQTQSSGGQKRVDKLGLAPQIREGAEYEFAIVFDLLRTHKAQCSKDNTDLFRGDDSQYWDLLDGTVPHLIREWMTTAKPAVPKPTPATLTLSQAEALTVRGKTIKSFDDTRLVACRAWAEGEKDALIAKACDMVMAARAANASEGPMRTTALPTIAGAYGEGELPMPSEETIAKNGAAAA